MPDIDPTSPFAHLIQPATEYKETIDMMSSGLYDTDEVNELSRQRSILHDQIIEECRRLGITIVDREDAMRKAFQIAQWFPSTEE